MALTTKAQATMAGPRPVVFSGPSGAGKSTLLKKLIKEHENVFGFSVSHTTRNPRPGEENGRDYHYVTREAMQAAINNGEFIENAEFSGNLYGTSKAAVQAVQAKNLICILDIDMQGVKNIKKTNLNPMYISIQPPSMEILEKRLRDRNTESEESLQKRLHAAKVDMELSKEPGMFDVVIVNDNLEDAYKNLQQALLEPFEFAKHLMGPSAAFSTKLLRAAVSKQTFCLTEQPSPSSGSSSASLRRGRGENIAGKMLPEAAKEAASLPWNNIRPPHIEKHWLSHLGPPDLPLKDRNLTGFLIRDVTGAGGAIGFTFSWDVILQVCQTQNTISLFQNHWFRLLSILILWFKDNSLLSILVISIFSKC
ncbi:hypothetical protein CCH79_00005405 [Gambusia affinis]|uniref:Guanylate kinase n=1 Tax=Gambusia affinis TaxID=33528 RepID=A0A315VQV4_GAMAF|nr:hypothetical protein CCH79_00005405 [Gambusia affinis]